MISSNIEAAFIPSVEDHDLRHVRLQMGLGMTNKTV